MKAKRELTKQEKKDMTMKYEIAEELGYCDQFYFCRYFKERQGMTPSAYRQRYALAYDR